MLWYKAWLETRWRMLMPTGMILFMFYQAHSQGRLLPGNIRMLIVLPLFWILAPMVLAGSGIATESPFRSMKGIEGSIYFTLALPVSRLRLFAMRAGLGMLETAAILAAMLGVAGIAFPELSATIAPADAGRYGVTALACITPVFGFATLVATFLDQRWQTLATLAGVFLLRALTGDDGFIFGAMGSSSPLVTHSMPWSVIALSLVMTVAFFLAAAKIVQSRQY